MASLRSFWRSRNWLVAVVILAAVLLRSAIPAGYMVSQQAGTPQVLLCHASSGAKDEVKAQTALRHLAAIVQQGQPDPGPASAATDPCPYAVLSFASLAGADPILLAAALVFVLAIGFAAQPLPPIRRARFFTPPMRAPPALS